MTDQISAAAGEIEQPDEQASADTPATDGIYSTCPICFAIAASGAGHEAWHMSRGEGMTDADHERA